MLACHGQASLSKGHLARWMPKRGQPFKLDLVKAKQLLTEAGYPEGFWRIGDFRHLPHSAPIAQSIQQNAAKVGVKLSLERMANAQLFSCAART